MWRAGQNDVVWDLGGLRHLLGQGGQRESLDSASKSMVRARCGHQPGTRSVSGHAARGPSVLRGRRYVLLPGNVGGWARGKRKLGLGLTQDQVQESGVSQELVP